MPWKESVAVDQRLDFVREALSNRFTMSELCERYGVSRRIGYKWLARFAEDGKRGLADRSRRPHTCPTAGLPRAIRTDNGVPFATCAIHGLSHLNVWWMRLGIAHERIHPGCRQENGAHERMHRTLKRRAVKPVQRTCAGQQKQFDAFRHEYNTERPHEALQLETPASRYRSSPRPLPPRLPAIEYPGHFLVKRVTDAGTFRFQQRLLYLANALVDQWIGLEERDDGVWSIYFNTVLLATLEGAGLHSRVTKSVTYVLGHVCYLSLRLLSGKMHEE
jgi:hypothetical protein